MEADTEPSPLDERPSLSGRVARAKAEWVERAQGVLDESRRQAAEKLEEMREEIDELKESLSVEVTIDELPEIEIPQADLNGRNPGLPLVDSRWSFVEQCQALIAAKRYSDDGAP